MSRPSCMMRRWPASVAQCIERGDGDLFHHERSEPSWNNDHRNEACTASTAKTVHGSINWMRGAVASASRPTDLQLVLVRYRFLAAEKR